MRRLPTKPSQRIKGHHRQLRFETLESRNLLTLYGAIGYVYHELSAGSTLLNTFPLSGALVAVDVRYDLITIDQGTVHSNVVGQSYTGWGTGNYSVLVDVPESTFAYSTVITGVSVTVAAESQSGRTQVLVGTPNGLALDTVHFVATPTYNIDQYHNISIAPITISQSTAPDLATAASFAAFTNLLAAAQFNDTLQTSSPTETVIPAFYNLGSAGAFDEVTRRIEFDARGAYSIDVMAHEAGHWFADANGFHNVGLGAPHNFNINLRIPKASLSLGSQFAFNEGFATWFSFVVQDNISAPKDKTGTVSEDGWKNSSYDLASATGVVSPWTTLLGFGPSTAIFEGEDDEAAVVRLLWSLYDAAAGGSSPPTDRVQMTPDEIIGNYIMGADAANGYVDIDGVWDQLIAGVNIQDQAKYGALMELNHIAVHGLTIPGGTTTFSNKYSKGAVPVFTWAVPAQTGGPYGATDRILSEFRVRVFDDKWNEINITDGKNTGFNGKDSQFPGDGGTYVKAKNGVQSASWAPDEDQWKAIAKTPGKMHWLVESRTNDGAFQTGDYLTDLYNFDVTFEVNVAGFQTDEVGGQQKEFLITIPETQSQTVTIPYTIRGSGGNPATVGDDFVVPSGATGGITIPAGQTSVSVAVLIDDDMISEGDETLELELSDPPDFKLSGTKSAQATIRDVLVSVPATVSVNENDPNKAATVTVALSNPTFNETTRVWFTLSDGPAGGNIAAAKLDKDYRNPANNFVDIPPGVSSFDIQIPIVDDKYWEGDERFTLEIFYALGTWANIVQASKSTAATIVDDEGKPQVYVQDASIVEGADGAKTNMTIIVGVTSLLEDQSITFDWVTDDWATAPRATENKDYEANGDPIEFTPSDDLTKAIDVVILGDEIYEDDELFAVLATNIVGAEPVQWKVAGKEGKGTIINDEAPPKVSIYDTSVDERTDPNNAAVAQAVVEVWLDRKTEKKITIEYKTQNGNATDPDDYLGTQSGTIEIDQGESGAITIPIVGDSKKERDETFTVKLTNVTPGSIDPAADTAAVTINDDDNHAPNGMDDAADTEEGESVDVDALSNDFDEDEIDVVSIESVGAAQNGTAVLQNGVIHYTPNPGFKGTDQFSYTITDGDTIAMAVVTVTVREKVDAIDDGSATDEDAPVVVDVLANDRPQSAVSIVNFTQPAHGTVSLSQGGSVMYTPNSGWSGEDSFLYTIQGTNGKQGTATVTITVRPKPNDPPIAVGDGASTPKNTAVTINVLGNDADPDGDPLSITEITQPANGSVSLDATGNPVYTPNADFGGPDSFGYTISDGHGHSASAIVSVTVGRLANGYSHDNGYWRNGYDHDLGRWASGYWHDNGRWANGYVHDNGRWAYGYLHDDGRWANGYWHENGRWAHGFQHDLGRWAHGYRHDVGRWAEGYDHENGRWAEGFDHDNGQWVDGWNVFDYDENGQLQFQFWTAGPFDSGWAYSEPTHDWVPDPSGGTTWTEAAQVDPAWHGAVARRAWIPDPNGGTTWTEASSIDPDWQGATPRRRWIPDPSGGTIFTEAAQVDQDWYNPQPRREWIPQAGGGTTWTEASEVDADWHGAVERREWIADPNGSRTWTEAEQPDEANWYTWSYEAHYLPGQGVTWDEAAAPDPAWSWSFPERRWFGEDGTTFEEVAEPDYANWHWWDDERRWIAANTGIVWDEVAEPDPEHWSWWDEALRWLGEGGRTWDEASEPAADWMYPEYRRVWEGTGGRRWDEADAPDPDWYNVVFEQRWV